MKKFNNPSTILIILAMAFLAFGCAQTDYPCVTDEAQANASYNNNDGDNGGPGGHPTGFINTNGKAHIIEAFRFAAIFADGTVSEHLNFFDQKSPANGVPSSTMYNYEHTHTLAALGGNPNLIFHGDQYCNPDWTGCSSVTNTNNVFCNDGSGKGGLTINLSCPGTSRLIILVGDIIRDAECGRASVNAPNAKLGGLGILDVISMIAENSEQVEFEGKTWNRLTLNPSLTLTYGNGNVYGLTLPSAGVPVFAGVSEDFRIQVMVDLRDPEFANTLADLQAIADANPGQFFGLTAEIFGRSLDFSAAHFQLIDSSLAPDHYTNLAAQYN